MTVAPGKLDTAGVEEIGEPAGGDGEILAEGLLVGVCGTDVEIAQYGYGVPPDGHQRIVLFHESLGRVLDAPAASGFAAGDLVVGIVRRPCPQLCPPCGHGQWDFCRTGDYTERGIKRRDGYGAQRWRVETGFAVKVSEAVGELGVLMEPTSVVAKAWAQVDAGLARFHDEPRTVLVTGAGPIGLLAALIGVQRGLDVHVLDRVTGGPKPQLVADLGATYHSGGMDALGFAPDVVIEATGVGQVVFDAMAACHSNAVVVLTGISAGTRTVEAHLDAVNKQLVLTNEAVIGSVNANRTHYQAAADALSAADNGWLSRLITRRVPMDRWAEALHKEDDDVKVVVELQS